jgi:L-tyrosine peroxygenase
MTGPRADDRLGIPPIVLPMPEDMWCAEPDSTDVASTTSETDRRSALPEPGAAPVAVEDRAMYRWMLGHQAAFGVWLLLSDNLRAMARGELGPCHQDIVAWLFDRYSETLVYSGSCSTKTYADHIRPAMTLAHPAFSGRWGRDYETVQGLLREIGVSPSTTVGNAFQRNRRIHVRVARKLVPEGGSLFRNAGGPTAHPTSDTERDLYDRFFRVQRRLTSRRSLLNQLTARFTAMHRDIARYPLDAADVRDVPDDLLLSTSVSAAELCAVFLPPVCESRAEPCLSGRLSAHAKVTTGAKRE